MSLFRLIQIAPPPKAPLENGSPKKWRIVKEHLGIPLPEDYKAFIDCYGTGTFNNFILVYNPFAAHEDANLFQIIDTHHQAKRHTRLRGDPLWSVVAPFELFPESVGLLPWGTTPDFDISFFWQVSGSPDTWVTIVYNLRVGEYEVWKMPCTSFLSKLFLREIESVLLPDHFPPDPDQIYFAQTGIQP
ncbi:MAG: hypothetical protein MUO62_18290 [Anaerolineales bacterium]|nr:hypothetical protein [Anaerolineales bacterium]